MLTELIPNGDVASKSSGKICVEFAGDALLNPKCRIFSQKYRIPVGAVELCLSCRLSRQFEAVSGSLKGLLGVLPHREESWLGLRGGELLLHAFGWQSTYDGRICEPTGARLRDTKQKL